MSHFWHKTYSEKSKSPDVIAQSGRGHQFQEKDILKLGKQIQDFFNLNKTLVVADVGCANGLFTKMMQPYCQRIYAIEPVPELLYNAKKQVGHDNNVCYVAAQGEKLPLKKKSVDRILLYGVLQLVGECQRDKIFEECWRISKNGMKLYLGSILDEKHQEKMSTQYLKSLEEATHLSDVKKQEIRERVSHITWHKEANLVSWWEDKGARVEKQYLPQTDPNFGERYHLLVSYGGC